MYIYWVHGYTDLLSRIIMLIYRQLRSGIGALLILPLLATVRRSAARGPCDPLVPEYCQLPFPNSFFTAPSSHTPTGVQVNFSTHTFPVDVFGRLADPGEWNTLGNICARGRTCRICGRSLPAEFVGGAKLFIY